MNKWGKSSTRCGVVGWGDESASLGRLYRGAVGNDPKVLPKFRDQGCLGELDHLWLNYENHVHSAPVVSTGALGAVLKLLECMPDFPAFSFDDRRGSVRVAHNPVAHSRWPSRMSLNPPSSFGGLWCCE